MEETELSLGLELGLGLGLPGVGGGEIIGRSSGVGNKRGYSDTVELKLSSSSDHHHHDHNQTADNPPLDLMNNDNNSGADKETVKPPAKAQVVGWPPVRLYRKNMLAAQKSTGGSEAKAEKKAANTNVGGGAMVKVSMDGAPYLRKVDLKMYKSYQDLSHALSKMFSSFTLGCLWSHANDFVL